MIRTRASAAALAALLALAACDGARPPAADEVETANAAANEAGNATAAATNVTLPPSIRASRTYRCTGDNSVIEVNFLADDVTANLRPGGQDTAAPIVLTAPAPGQPYVAEGYSLSGSGVNVTYDSPTRASQPCRAGPASS